MYLHIEQLNFKKVVLKVNFFYEINKYSVENN
jgi:hypothetical protein